MPKNMEMTEQGAIQKLMADNGFATFVSPDLQASHLPITYSANEGEKGTLYGHMAKSNPQWRTLEGQKVLVIFSGPHGYISPTWYETSPAVPTWNYASVHCYGTVTLLDNAETLKTMDGLIDKYEPELLNNTDLMPKAYQEKLVNAVVGFKVTVTDIQAKEKLGQHRKKEDQVGVAKALSSSALPGDLALLAYMQDRELGIG